MKTLYFVRHGESVGNASEAFQFDYSELSEKGHEQAKAVAERATRINFDVLITSPMPRALETANYIHQATGKAIEHSDLFVERRRPRAQQGLVRTSPEALAIEEGIRTSSRTPGYRYADEENFDDLVHRAQKALHYLENLPSENILVVTHGLFLRVLVCCAIYGDKVTGEMLYGFFVHLRVGNTGLTVMRYDDPIEPHTWLLTTWNDRVHLG